MGEGLETVVITITNWAEYQDTRAAKKAKWFKFWNHFPQSRAWDVLSPTEIKFLVFILCKVSTDAHQFGSVETTFRALSRQTCIRINKVRTSLDRLRTIGFLQYQILIDGKNTNSCLLEKKRKDKIREEGDSDLNLVGGEGEKPKIPAEVLQMVRKLQGRGEGDE